MCHTQAQGGGRESSLRECHEVSSVTSLTGVPKREERRPLCCLFRNDKSRFSSLSLLNSVKLFCSGA